MKIAVPLALFTLAIGIGAGIVMSRDREPRAANEDAVRPGAVAADVPAAENDDRLARLESEVAALRAEVERLRESGGRAAPASSGLAASEGKATIASLTARVPELVRTRDGEELLRVIKELSKLGEEGCAAAAGIAQDLWKAVYDEGETGWGLDDEGLERALFSGPMLPLMLWALQNPDGLEEGFRQNAAYYLEDMPNVDPTFVRNALLAERDPLTAASLARLLVTEETPQSIQDLEAAVHAHSGEPDMLERLMWTFWNLKSPDALRALDRFAASENVDLRSQARTALLAVSPPPGTVFITGVYTGNNTGTASELRRGDLVLSVDGLNDLSQFKNHLATVHHDEWISIRVRRGDVDETVRVKGRSIQVGTIEPR